MMALPGLAVLAVTKVANRYVSLAAGAWEFMLVALGVGAAWLINLNLFATWDIPVRSSQNAVTITGVMVAGAAYFWRPVLDFFTGLSRKFTDEAATIEQSQHLRRVA